MIVCTGRSPGAARAVSARWRRRSIPLDTSRPGSERVLMTGRICRSEFHGGHIRYSIDVAGQVIVCDSPHRSGTLVMAVGTEVVVGVEISQVRFVNG